MTIEERMRAHLKDLAKKTDDVKRVVDEDFWKDFRNADGKTSLEAMKSFFDVVVVKTNDGRSARVFKGFLNASISAMKRQEKDIIASARSGAENSKELHA